MNKLLNIKAHFYQFLNKKYIKPVVIVGEETFLMIYSVKDIIYTFLSISFFGPLYVRKWNFAKRSLLVDLFFLGILRIYKNILFLTFCYNGNYNVHKVGNFSVTLSGHIFFFVKMRIS